MSIDLGDGWTYEINANRIGHEHADGPWTAPLKSFPYQCAKCEAVLPEHLEFPVRVAVMDHDQQQGLGAAQLASMIAAWDRAHMKLVEEIMLTTGDGVVLNLDIAGEEE